MKSEVVGLHTTAESKITKLKYTNMDRRQSVFKFCIFLMCGYAILNTFFLLRRSQSNSVLKVEETYESQTAQSNLINSKGDADGVPQEDFELVEYVRRNYLIAPAPNETEYALNATKTIIDPSLGPSKKIRLASKNMTGGFFIECGALDGETRSNTLYLERFMGWRGLLVEANPSNVEMLKKVNRKAWVMPTCLSIKPYPVQVSFSPNWSLGKIHGIVNDSATSGSDENSHTIQQDVFLQCIPITTLLLALNVTHVDYFSLDVEGSELEVLKTIDFLKFDITMLSVEYKHVKEGKAAVKKFMKSKGYRVDSEIRGNDFIFVKNSK